MTPAEIQSMAVKIASELQSQPVPWVGYLCVALLCIGSSFFAEWGKNRALKLDLRKLTEDTESVKHHFAKLTARIEARQEMRAACLEQRMRIHQEAFEHYRDLLRVMNNREKVDVASFEMEKWWERNCLYLDPEPRSQFIEAVRMVTTHKDFVAIGDAATARADWAQLKRLGECIVRAAGLPTIKEDQAPHPATLG